MKLLNNGRTKHPPLVFRGLNLLLSSGILFLLILTSGCGKKITPEEEKYIASIEEHRHGKNTYMKENPNSPFNYKGKVEFHELNYFDVDPEFKFKSRLYEYEPKDTVIIFGTKGEERKTIRFGSVQFDYRGKKYNINVYEGITRTGQKYYSIWFTDLTTNKESYGVGRYIDFEKHPDPEFVYEIDFNLAYNPYCAYSPDYSCAIPSKEDFIPIEIRAGEKKFHD